jgi:D-3-phosphoglycerate dehydrogenase
MDILIPEELQAGALSAKFQKYQVSYESALWRNPSVLKTALATAKVLMVRNQTQVTGDLLEAAPRLLGVGRLGVGLDNIDLATASRLGIVVVAPLGANATSVAELALGLILALARKIPQADQSTKAGSWDRKGCTGVELEGKTLAICGFGRIGAKVARRAHAFGMRNVTYDPFLKADSPVLHETGTLLSGNLEDALAQADFVSVHLPLSPETHHLFGSKTLACLKPGAFFINTSRGAIVDEAALLDALRAGRLAGAALDVRETEPPLVRGQLEAMPNVLLTPHLGACTSEAQQRTFNAVADDMDRLLSGEAAINFVNFERPRRT